MKKTIITLFILLIANLMVAQEGNKDDSLAARICAIGYIHWPGSTPATGFEKAILKHLGLPPDIKNKGKYVSKFFNENNARLICDDDTDMYGRENEHIFKRMLALSEHEFIVHVANSTDYYDFDWNFYEMVDGKKETIIDYIEKIINDPDMAEEYDIPELNSLIRTIEQSGARRGKEASLFCNMVQNFIKNKQSIASFEKEISKKIYIYAWNDREREEKTSLLFNQASSLFICGKTNNNYIRENEHFLKRILANKRYDYLMHLVKNKKYLDWNFYEIVDGKKETMLDYIDKIINDPELAQDYNIPELKTLVRTIEGRGGKRGRELK